MVSHSVLVCIGNTSPFHIYSQVHLGVQVTWYTCVRLHISNIVDYDETFNPLVKPAIVRTVLTLALSQRPVHQLDVKNTFHNGTLTETVYCFQPTSFVDSGLPNHVCHLNKSLYAVAEPELKSIGGQFHKLMPHLTRCYYLPACACSMNKRSQQVRWKMRWSACAYVRLVWWHCGWAPTSFNTMPVNALRREMLVKHILSLRSIAIVVGSSSQLSWELKKSIVPDSSCSV